MKKNIAILLFFILSSFQGISYADRIILKSGQEIDGELIEKTDQYLKIKFEGVTLTYPLDEIKSISGIDIEIDKLKPHSPLERDKEGKVIDEMLSLVNIKSDLSKIQQYFFNVDFYEVIYLQFRNNFDESKAKENIKWFTSPLGREIATLEKKQNTPGTTRTSVSALPIRRKVPEEREKLLNQIDELTGSSDFWLESMLISQKEYMNVINELLPDNKRKSKSEIDSWTKDMIKEIREPIAVFNYLAQIFESISDDELIQYIDFLKTDAARWFNNCYKAGFQNALVEAVQIRAKMDNLAAEALEILKKEFVLPDSPEWFITYYYRTKEKERVIPLLKSILADQSFGANQKRKAELVHFFASVIHDQNEPKTQILALKNFYTNAKKEFLEAVILEADNFKTVIPDSPLNIDRAWIEFQATGNEECVKAIISILGFADQESHKELQRFAQVSLLRHAVSDLDVRGIITKLTVNADDIAAERIETILSLVESFIEISKTAMQRAYNYKELNQLDDALRENEEALLFRADYSTVLNNLSNIYEEKGDKKKALLYRQASVYLDLEYYVGYYNLGRYYFFEGVYDEAIKNYLKAVEYNPKDPTYNHALARAYQEKGDVENAVEYFRKYLEYAPSGEFASLVRNYLASVKVPFKEDETNPVVMLKNRQFDKLEKFLYSLLKKKEKDKNGKGTLSNIYLSLIEPKGTEFISEQLLPLFEEWVKAKPNSHFANGCLGAFYVHYAWQARGSGYAETIVEEGARLFEERLLKAEEYLEKAYQLDSSDPIVPIELINVSLGLGYDRKTVEKQFQRAVTADPTEYRAYYCKLLYLMPKWYGSWEEMFLFARESAKNAPLDTLIPKVLIDAHWEMYWRSEDKTYFKKPEVWSEVKNIYIQLLGSFPDSFELRNWFALVAYYAGDYKTAKEQFDLIGDNWEEGRAWKSLKAFEKTKNAVIPVQ